MDTDNSVEALARLLCVADNNNPDTLFFELRMTRWWRMAEFLVNNPSDLVEALWCAGVEVEFLK